MKIGWIVTVTLLAMGITLSAAPPQPAGAEKFPEKKWFQNGKGYAEALEIQKKTGADLFIYFARYSPSDQKGLCNWFEQRLLQNPTVEKSLREYVKVKFTFPLSKGDNAIAEKFGVNKCPALYVVQPSGMYQRVTPFNWTNKQPKPVEPDNLVEQIRAKSGKSNASPP